MFINIDNFYCDHRNFDSVNHALEDIFKRVGVMMHVCNHGN